MRAKAAAILAAQRTRRQREHQLLANQWTKIDLVSIVGRELEIIDLEIMFVGRTDRARRQNESKRRRGRRIELLGAAGACGSGPRLDLPGEKQVGARSIIRNIHGDRSFHLVLAHGPLPQNTVDFRFRLGKGNLLCLGGYVVQPKFHGNGPDSRARDAGLLHFGTDVQIRTLAGFRNWHFGARNDTSAVLQRRESFLRHLWRRIMAALDRLRLRDLFGLRHLLRIRGHSGFVALHFSRCPRLTGSFVRVDIRRLRRLANCQTPPYCVAISFCNKDSPAIRRFVSSDWRAPVQRTGPIRF